MITSYLIITMGVVLLIVSVVCVFSNYYYWKDHLSGWLDCEKVIQDRANESSKRAEQRETLQQ